MNKQLREELMLAGAELRYQRLKAELNAIEAEFPAVVNGIARTIKTTPRPVEKRKMSTRKGGRKRMSAAERKAVGERMRKYWAERRKQQASK